MIGIWVASKCSLIKQDLWWTFFLIHLLTLCGYFLRIISKTWNCWVKQSVKILKADLWKDGAPCTRPGLAPGNPAVAPGPRNSVLWTQDTELPHSGQKISPAPDSDLGGLQWSPGTWIFKQIPHQFWCRWSRITLVNAHSSALSARQLPLRCSEKYSGLGVITGNFFFSEMGLVFLSEMRLVCEHTESVDANTRSYRNSCWAFPPCSCTISSLVLFSLPPSFFPPPYLHFTPIPGNLCQLPHCYFFVNMFCSMLI